MCQLIDIAIVVIYICPEQSLSAAACELDGLKRTEKMLEGCFGDQDEAKNRDKSRASIAMMVMI